jgi:hypothetical protein
MDQNKEMRPLAFFEIHPSNAVVYGFSLSIMLASHVIVLTRENRLGYDKHDYTE